MNKWNRRLGIGLLTATMGGAPLFADDTKSGNELHDTNCISCHDNTMYTRKNSFIKSMASLKTQVQRCDTNLDLGWFNEEVNSVAAYLNGKYYHF